MASNINAELDSGPGACRCCGGTLAPSFKLQVLHRHDVVYLVCTACGSLQTQPPYWLAEAYASNLSNLDTGAAQRNLKNLAASHVVIRLLGLPRVLDVGGGDGLLCRLLRDHGADCYVQDKYAKPAYAQGYDRAPFDVPDLVLAFEVFEHLANPINEIEPFFAGRPAAVLVSTELYEGQGADWHYLAPESGQHVFFYSRRALQGVAVRFGYHLLVVGEFRLFFRAGVAGLLEINLLRLLLRPRVCRWVAAVMMLRATPGVMRDHLTRKSHP